MIHRFILFTTLTLFFLNTNAARISGKVYDAINNEPIEFANVMLQNTTLGSVTNEKGEYTITDIQPGLYNVVCSYLGFKDKIIFEVQISDAVPVTLDIAMEKNTKEINEIIVTTKSFIANIESPTSLSKIGINEIKRNPGSNRDISKVILSLPGVGSSNSFRNDIFIRGGSSAENKFYIDGIEIPIINHFQTQGATGGPIGILNPEMINEVNFYAGAFPVNRSNTLSSVFDFVMKDGRNDRIGGTFTIGASEAGVSLEGPISKTTNFTMSYRKSYLQFLFQAIGLPFLPTYNDFYIKTKTKFNTKNELTFISIGSLDYNKLNLEANKEPYQRYILGNIPESNQWAYTQGLHFKHFHKNATTSLILSRNMQFFNATKFIDNKNTNPKILDYESYESENKFRAEHTWRRKNYKFQSGLDYQYISYYTNTLQVFANASGLVNVNYKANLYNHKAGLFTQVSAEYLEGRLNVSMGLRTDATIFNKSMRNPLNQLSPRASLSFSLSPNFTINANAGIYYQLPPFTYLGYSDANNVKLNTNAKFIKAKHGVLGVSYTGLPNSRFTAEGFYKKYSQYPFMLNDSLSLANLGADFGVVGNGLGISNSEGLAYGTEFTFQQKLYKGFFGIIALTLVRSQFEHKGNLYPSAWDAKAFTTITAGKKFKRNWELGIKWRYSGGNPYTPIDTILSSNISYWNVNKQGIKNYNLLNSQRTNAVHALDMRIDKKWFLRRINFNLYLDIQNLYSASSANIPYFDIKYDAMGNPLINTNDTSRYQYELIDDASGTTLPTIGVIVEF